MVDVPFTTNHRLTVCVCPRVCPCARACANLACQPAPAAGLPGSCRRQGGWSSGKRSGSWSRPPDWRRRWRRRPTAQTAHKHNFIHRLLENSQFSSCVVEWKCHWKGCAATTFFQNRWSTSNHLIKLFYTWRNYLIFSSQMLWYERTFFNMYFFGSGQTLDWWATIGAQIWEMA